MTGRAARILIAPIHFYQRFISPALPPSCRFAPTCSAYAVGAITEHGVVRGIWMAIKRIGKCHPWHKGGWDPVPPRKNKSGDQGAAGRKTESSHVVQRVASADSPAPGLESDAGFGSGSAGVGENDNSVISNSTTNSLGLVASTQSFGRGTT